MLLKAFEVILALVRIVPAIKSAFDAFVSFYVSRQIEGMRSDHREGIRRAITEHDQRALEQAIRSPFAGQPSGLPGSVIRDTLPGVNGVRNPQRDPGKSVAQ